MRGPTGAYVGWMRRLLLLVAVLLVGPLTMLAVAQETRLGGKLRAGQDVTIPAGETVQGDLYVFGRSLVVRGTVTGDVVVFAGTVEIPGTVNGDLTAGAGVVSVSGRVGGDARIGAGTVNVAGEIAEDVLAGVGQLSLASGSRVGQDVIMSVGTASMAGVVTGSIVGTAGNYSRSGTIGGTEDVTLTEAPTTRPQTATDEALDAVRHFVLVIIFGALALWLAPRAFVTAETALRTRPMNAFVAGIVACGAYVALMIAIVIATVLVAISAGLLGLGNLVAVDVITGLLLGAGATFAFVLAASFLADALVGLAVGRTLAPGASADPLRTFILLAAGALVIVALTSVPVIGGVVKLVVVLVGLGALGTTLLNAWRARRPMPPAPTPAA